MSKKESIYSTQRQYNEKNVEKYKWHKMDHRLKLLLTMLKNKNILIMENNHKNLEKVQRIDKFNKKKESQLTIIELQSEEFG